MAALQFVYKYLPETADRANFVYGLAGIAGVNGFQAASGGRAA